MPTYDVAAAAGVPARGSSNVSVIKQIVDFDALYKTVDGSGNITWNKPVAADVVKPLKLKANSQVLGYGVRCLVAPVGTALTVTFGGTSGTFAGTFDQTTTVGALKPATVTAGLVSVATDLTATLTTITTCTALGKYEFYAIVADLN